MIKYCCLLAAVLGVAGCSITPVTLAFYENGPDGSMQPFKAECVNIPTQESLPRFDIAIAPGLSLTSNSNSSPTLQDSVSRPDPVVPNTTTENNYLISSNAVPEVPKLVPIPARPQFTDSELNDPDTVERKLANYINELTANMRKNRKKLAVFEQDYREFLKDDVPLDEEFDYVPKYPTP